MNGRHPSVSFHFRWHRMMAMMKNDDIQMNHLDRCILGRVSPHPGHGTVKSQRLLDKSLHVRQPRPLRIPAE